MTLLQLRYISEVAKQGSFCKAAQNLYVSQPGISKMVAALEKELGITDNSKSPISQLFPM